MVTRVGHSTQDSRVAACRVLTTNRGFCLLKMATIRSKVDNSIDPSIDYFGQTRYASCLDGTTSSPSFNFVQVFPLETYQQNSHSVPFGPHRCLVEWLGPSVWHPKCELLVRLPPKVINWGTMRSITAFSVLWCASCAMHLSSNSFANMALACR